MKRWVHVISFVSILRRSTTNSLRRSCTQCCLSAPRTTSPLCNQGPILSPCSATQPVRTVTSGPQTSVEHSPAFYVHALDKGLNVTENIVQKIRTLTSEQIVRFFIDIMNFACASEESPEKHRQIKIILRDMSSGPNMNTVKVGLSCLIDMRETCARMIRTLPEPGIMMLDRILLEVLREVVTYDTTVVTKVSRDSSYELIETVRRCDRVHPIRDERALQHRLSDHRTVFILTHHVLPARPLVILHVAHSNGMFQSVTDILQGGTLPLTEDTLCRLTDTGSKSNVSEAMPAEVPDILYDLKTDTGKILSSRELTADSYDHVHTFYSISSLEIGLRGIPVGGWLVSKAKVILADPTNRTIYSTLSPIPGLTHWIKVSLKRDRDSINQILGDKREELSALLTSQNPLTPGKPNPDHHVPDSLRDTLARLAVFYLLCEKQRGLPLDTVAQFHVGNGAAVWAIRWAGTRSQEMSQQSLGLMVNYLYDANSPTRAQQYHKHQTIDVGTAIQEILDTF